MTVKDTDLGYQKFLRDWEELGKPDLIVGIRGDKVDDDEGFPMAAIGAANEFGVRDDDGSVIIPERSFLRSTVSENQEKYFKLLARGLGEVVDGDITVEKALGLVGLKIVGDVQGKIVAIKIPKNADSTIARKGVDNPLINDGHMKAAIDFLVRPNGAGS